MALKDGKLIGDLRWLGSLSRIDRLLVASWLFLTAFYKSSLVIITACILLAISAFALTSSHGHSHGLFEGIWGLYFDPRPQSHQETARFVRRIAQLQQVHHWRAGNFVSAPPNPPQVPQHGQVLFWKSNDPSWLQLKLEPIKNQVGWQFETRTGTGPCAAPHPAACEGLPSKRKESWFWVIASNSTGTIVFNSSIKEPNFIPAPP